MYIILSKTMSNLKKKKNIMTQIHIPKRLKSEEGKHGIRSHTLYIKLIPTTLIPFLIIEQYLANLNSKSNLDLAIACKLNINNCK